MPGADAAHAMPRLRSAIQIAKQQSVRMGEFAIEEPIVSWKENRTDGESEAHKAYDEALRELTRASLHVASNLLQTPYESPPCRPHAVAPEWWDLHSACENRSGSDNP